MKFLSLFTTLLLSAAVLLPAASAQDWRKDLKADVVTVKDGKMIIERAEILKTEEEGESVSLQVKLVAECPESAGISRDNFLVFTMVAYMKMLEGVAGGEAYSTESLEGLIGKADIEINVDMTKDGFQLRSVNNKSGDKDNATTKWADIFKKKG
ncbi:MAG: hypothetical protein JSR82_02145 [Verrucomicrobia bacterium]|nr:hypothetical protein [Verrucomicrobiota bacterium]